MINFKSIEDNTSTVLSKILEMSNEEVIKKYFNVRMRCDGPDTSIDYELDGNSGVVNGIQLHYSNYDIIINHYSKLDESIELNDDYELVILRNNSNLVQFKIKDNNLIKLYNELIYKFSEINDLLLNETICEINNELI